MISVAEWGDDIMLSIADDYRHFKTLQVPLINSHYSKQLYFYKSTGFVQEGRLLLYYTARNSLDKCANQLFFIVKHF